MHDDDDGHEDDDDNWLFLGSGQLSVGKGIVEGPSTIPGSETREFYIMIIVIVIIQYDINIINISIIIIQIPTTSSTTVTGGRGFSVVVGPGYIPGSVTSDSNIITIVIIIIIIIIIFRIIISSLIIISNVTISFKKYNPYHFVNDGSWWWWSVEDGHLGVTMGWSGDRTCGRLWNIDLNQSWI